MSGTASRDPTYDWRHLRTTDPIESSFATVRHRTDRTRGAISRDSIVPFVFKLGKVAEQHWRKLNGFNYLAKVITGVRFRDGIEVRDNSPPKPGRRLTSHLRTPDFGISPMIVSDVALAVESCTRHHVHTPPPA